MDAGEAGNPWIDEEVYLGASRIPVFLNFTECVDYGYVLEGNGNNQTIKQNSTEKSAALQGLGKEQVMVCPHQHFISEKTAVQF